ncbi:hypothetical protein GLOIN_2v1651552 [Rhizophagus irregularis DAOM 181602=DAOM 197198]|uniref:Uncharacterized protein n=1 Tax=Rhizophagus irregularis (strain DAOM 181602 / DAOM 197198 / MUCL 43194) TaxID=747089 RepID=A0A2P4PNP9_RHIID|nr:hypothetical protein GLOIN_2v1651552 [Rhizophagus irregularis DAOM 181602=DAOM 197198]POG67002.1 hypothetical protein GLOIN_2v1651552 [Rhizophagus irregularis DAOM 181602=DAOM 197198]|eukprot:XP_025173868.1 hypothetical protein GLOIN_2v1651552 [Rhizophagus irregularis DAOM 181602=DAOM 197198]
MICYTDFLLFIFSCQFFPLYSVVFLNRMNGSLLIMFFRKSGHLSYCLTFPSFFLSREF